MSQSAEPELYLRSVKNSRGTTSVGGERFLGVLGKKFIGRLSSQTFDKMCILMDAGLIICRVGGKRISVHFLDEKQSAILRVVRQAGCIYSLVAIPFAEDVGDIRSPGLGVCQFWHEVNQTGPQNIFLSGLICYRPGFSSLEEQIPLLAAALRDCKMIVVGGEHHLTYHWIRNHYAGPVHLVLIDAHHDRYEARRVGQRLNNANFVNWLASERLILSCTMIGRRDSSPINGKNPEWTDIPYVEIELQDPLWKQNIVKEICDLLKKKEAGMHISIDVDVCDPGLVPDVCAPLPNGISEELLSLIVREIVSNFEKKVLGVDIVEMCNGYNSTSKSVAVAQRLVTTLSRVF